VEVVAIDVEAVGGVEAVGVEAVGVEAVGGVEDIDTCDIINNTLVCYCIRNETKNKTYVGATNHFTRRIRQHNREIVGGAKSTAGHKWHKIILVHGFNTRHDLLSFEWHFKHVVTVNKNGVKRRVEALKKLLSIDRWKMLKVVVADELKELFT
jgi:predicted GIY-YIG superfamily endonuclease